VLSIDYRKMKSFTKALIIAFLIEAVLGGMWVWLFIKEGHTGLTLGGTFNLPGSIIGYMIGEKLRHYSATAALAACFLVSSVLQTFLFTFIFWFILRGMNSEKHPSGP